MLKLQFQPLQYVSMGFLTDSYTRGIGEHMWRIWKIFDEGFLSNYDYSTFYNIKNAIINDNLERFWVIFIQNTKNTPIVLYIF